MNNNPEEIIEKLNRAKTLAIFCHARPDGDALGAGLALYLALKGAGKTAYMCCDDLPPEKFSFLPAMKEVLTSLPEADYDTFVSVDCADVARLGSFAKRYLKFKGDTLNIDHHVSNDGYGKYNYIEVCPASCEVITSLFQEAGWTVTEEIANLLMLGLITDSGNFTHLDVSERTYSTAAYLRRYGADMNIINYNMFSRQSKVRALLYGKVMSGMRFALDDKLAIIVIPNKDLQSANADSGLTEGFVDFPLTVDGVEVAVSLMEYKPNLYKISLRSKGTVNVNAIAVGFGGGGHVLASGCLIGGPLEEVIEKLTYAIYQAL
ncbi:MAG: bifunctional oligoribonuclease/PAP phosphatase NrnA [Clostridia bacterium]|nr:bifunctional oligoribonuclease/PAP phosphatase NrnA [Clostridia bacterium]